MHVVFSINFFFFLITFKKISKGKCLEEGAESCATFPFFGRFWQAEGSPWSFLRLIFSRELGDGGRQELCFQQVVRRARPFSSSGPSRHFPHNDDDDPTHEADG